MTALRGAPVIFAVCLICGGIYLIFGPVRASASPDLALAFVKVFRHGDLPHLLFNLMILVFAGMPTENTLGSARLLALILLCICVGTVAQFLLVDGNFAGISGPAYGVAAFAILHGKRGAQRMISLGLIVLVLVGEVVFLSQSVAVYPHITSALIGGAFAMFGNLFGPKGPALKPMQMAHVAKVIEIINQTDDDDAAEAERAFLDGGGLEGMYVLMDRGQVMGCIGYSPDDNAPEIVWLSWTYLDAAYAGQGYGSQMMNDLLGILKDFGVRKVFIATSDYKEDGALIYAGAHRMYEDFGATVEMTIPDYHAVGEAKIIYGLSNPEYDPGPMHAPSENEGLAIGGSALEPETDNVRGLTWSEVPVGVAGLDHAMDKARNKGARMVVLAIPSDLSDANIAALETQGFTTCGKLDDYYHFGLHQRWWVCSL